MKRPILQHMAELKFPYSVLISALVFMAGASYSFAAAEEKEQRIVSLSPSITEIVFALGLGDRLVGVTRYCDYPKEAKKLPDVGGLYDPNLEVIISLKPSIIIGPEEHRIRSADFNFGEARGVFVKHGTIAEVKDSILKIGHELGRDSRAKELVRSISETIEQIAGERSGGTAPRVLVVVGGHRGVDSVYAAGQKTFYDEIITLAGGKNAYDGSVQFPKLSAESLLSINPDIVIDLIPELDPEKPIDKKTLLKAWQTLPNLKAVKSNQTFVFTEEYLVNPGPRIPLILKKFALVIRASHD